MPGKTCTTGSCPIKKSKPKKTVPKKPSVKKTSSSKTKKTKSSSKKMQCDQAVSKTNVVGNHQPTNTNSSVNKNCTSTSPTEETNSELLTKSHPVEYKGASSLLSPISMPAALSYTSGEDGSLTRRSSSGPPTEHDVFYQLKKDIERRMTLFQDLIQDQTNICKMSPSVIYSIIAFEWEYIKEDYELTFLTVNQLCLALDLFQSVVTLESMRKQALEEQKLHLGALEQLLVQKRLLLSLVNHISQNSDGDSTENHRMMQELLKRQKVYHSMLKKALEDYKIQLGTLRQWEDQMGLMSSVVNNISQISDGVSTENHRIMQELLKKQKVYQSMLEKTLEDYKLQLGAFRQLLVQMGLLSSLVNHISQNRIMQELLKRQKVYQSMLKQALEVCKLQLGALQLLEDQMALLLSVVNHISRNSDGEFSEGDMTSPESEANNHNLMTPRISVTDSSMDQLDQLVDWLQTLRQDDTAISKFLAEE